MLKEENALFSFVRSQFGACDKINLQTVWNIFIKRETKFIKKLF